jgi:hypothetical protein
VAEVHINKDFSKSPIAMVSHQTSTSCLERFSIIIYDCFLDFILIGFFIVFWCFNDPANCAFLNFQQGHLSALSENTSKNPVNPVILSFFILFIRGDFLLLLVALG